MNTHKQLQQLKLGSYYPKPIIVIFSYLLNRDLLKLFVMCFDVVLVIQNFLQLSDDFF